MVTFIIAFIIARTFIKVVSNKRLNGARVTAVGVVIHSFAGKEAEGSTRHGTCLCGIRQLLLQIGDCEAIYLAPHLIRSKKLQGWNERLITRSKGIE